MLTRSLDTLLYTVGGRAFDYGARGSYPASPEDRAHMAAFIKKLPQMVKDGSVVPPKIKLWEGGLDAMLDGFEYMREGKVSGEKIVYRL